MNQHRKRIDRLSEQIDFHMPAGDDDEIIVIKLVWPEQDPQPPITLRGGVGKVTVSWPPGAAEGLE